jgi:hypothetical protein
LIEQYSFENSEFVVGFAEKVYPYSRIIFLQVRVVHGLADCDFQDTSVMELFSNFIAELVNDGELILACAMQNKFVF